MGNSASFRFLNSLNDLLTIKNATTPYYFNGNPAIKDAIEAMGIPHTEVDVIFVNSSPVDFYYKLTDKDEAEVFPFESITKLNTHSLTPAFDHPLRFIADVNAGKLANALRTLGFDTLYENNLTDKTIAEIAEKENRIVLTRHIALLKHNSVKWGYWLRSQQWQQQLSEVISRYDLAKDIQPFTICLSCNGTIVPVSKESVIEQLPPKTNIYFKEFFQCISCRKVYWKGSHYERMTEKMKGWL